MRSGRERWLWISSKNIWDERDDDRLFFRQETEHSFAIKEIKKTAH